VRQVKKEISKRDDQVRGMGKKPTKKPGAVISPAEPDSKPSAVPPVLLGDLRSLIESARVRVAVGVNAEMVRLYWNIGTRIRRDILGKERAAYGKTIVATVSHQLTQIYGAGFGRANLFSMIRFAELYPDVRIVQTLSGKLSWSHFVELMKIDDPLQRDFYTEMCRLERWSVRTLEDLYEPES